MKMHLFMTKTKKKMYVPNETLVLSFTNNACQNILTILDKDAKVYTFDSKFYNEEGSENILNGVKRIFSLLLQFE